MACPLYRRGNRLGEDRDPRSLHFGEAGWGWAVMLGTLGAQGSPCTSLWPHTPALRPLLSRPPPSTWLPAQQQGQQHSLQCLHPGGLPALLARPHSPLDLCEVGQRAFPRTSWKPLAPPSSSLEQWAFHWPPAPGARPGTAVSPDIFRALGRGNHCGRPWGILATCAAPPWPSWSTLEPWGLGPALQACKPGPGLQQCLEASCPVPRPLGTQVQAARPEELGALGTPAASSTSSQLTRAPHLTGTG